MNLTDVLFGVNPLLFFIVDIVGRRRRRILAIGYAAIVVDPGGRASSHRDPPVICQLQGRDADERVVIAEAEEEDG